MTQAEKKENCIVVLTIEATPEKAELAWNKAVKEVRKHASLPGFRKGKLSPDLLKKNFSQDIEREFRSIFINTSAQEAMAETGLFPWDRGHSPKVDVQELSKEKGAKFIVEFETFPDVPDVDPATLKLNKIEPEPITDQDVTDYLDSLALSRAEFEEVDRPAKKDDFISANVTPLLDNDEKGAQQQVRLHMTLEHKNSMESWLYDALMGTEKGATIEVTPPERKEGSPRALAVAIEKIETAKRPEIDEAFAKHYGADSVDLLNERIKEMLEKEENKKAHQIHCKDAQDQILENYPFDLPLSLLKREADRNFNEGIQYMQQHGASEDDIEKAKEGLHKESTERAKRQLSLHYMFYRLAENQKLEVTDAEVMEESIVRSLNQGQFNAEQFKENEGYREEIRLELKMLKALNYVVDNANFS